MRLASIDWRLVLLFVASCGAAIGSSSAPWFGPRRVGLLEFVYLKFQGEPLGLGFWLCMMRVTCQHCIACYSGAQAICLYSCALSCAAAAVVYS